MNNSGKSLTLNGVTQRYGPMVAVDDVNFEINGGELVTLLGPSGCGKTTLLRIIAGFVSQSEGHVQFGGETVDSKSPGERGVGIVFQNYALFPHMTIAQNIAYGLEAHHVPKARRVARVEEMLALVQLDSFAGRFPGQLSGGQQQRVALARALAVGPSVLLLDEPFAALDKNLRLDLQIEIRRIQRQAGITTVLVTHDQEEALSMADRVAVLNKGKLEQFARPTDIYDHPASLFVSSFVGTTSQMTGKVLKSTNAQADIALCDGVVVSARTPVSLAEGAVATVCARPEHLEMISVTEPGGFAATVETGFPLGASLLHEVRLTDGTRLKISAPRHTDDEPKPSGEVVRVRVKPGIPVPAFPN